MMLNAKPSELAAVVGVIDPDANTAAALSTGWVDMRDFAALLGIVMAGDLGASGTLDAKFEQATSSGGAGVKDVTGKAITQLTQAGTDSNKQALINLRAEELDVENGFRYARLTMTTATATSDSAAMVLGLHPARGPASDFDATTVDEIVG
jgi:hypothetical protein